MDKKGIKDSLAHGKGNNKINAFASVPNVIKNGKRIDITKNNNKNENRYLFVAPISIKDKSYFCEVIVREPYSTKNGEKEFGKRRFYIHEVEVIEKLSDVFSRTFQQGTSESSKSIIADLINKLNPSVNKHEDNALFQDTNDNSNSDEKLIAGSTYEDIMLKMTDLWQDYENAPDKATEEDIIAKIHILENAFEYDIHPEKYSQELVTENALNVYYIMNNIEMPKETVEAELKSPRTYKDLLKSHKDKLEKQESEYYGYYKKENGKDIITIMSNHNASTALHELGHFFLNSLNELAKIDEDAKKQLEAVDKWLGRNGEYTRQQHEKFARSFESPNSRVQFFAPF